MNKKTLAVVLLVACLAGIIVAWGVSTWMGTITWELTTEDFSVWDSATVGSEITTPWAPTTLEIPSYPHTPLTYEFYLQNDGNVEITIDVTELSEVGCSGEWSSAGSYTVAEGSTRVLATLTLTITGDGGYSFEFNIV